jgi:hypothetical protein
MRELGVVIGGKKSRDRGQGGVVGRGSRDGDRVEGMEG